MQVVAEVLADLQLAVGRAAVALFGDGEAADSGERVQTQQHVSVVGNEPTELARELGTQFPRIPSLDAHPASMTHVNPPGPGILASAPCDHSRVRPTVRTAREGLWSSVSMRGATRSACVT